MFRHAAAALAAAGLLSSLAGCGGGDTSAPTPLPTTVTIASTDAAETGQATAFGTSIPARTQGVTYHWDFGDGGTATDAAPHHAFAASGEYEVSVGVANGAGDMRTARFHVSVGNFSNVQGAFCTAAGHGGWCWQDAYPDGHALTDITFAADGVHAWAVGRSGAIDASVDGGATWAPQASGVFDDFHAVRFADASHGWAIALDALMQTADGGSTWSAMSGLGFNNYDVSVVVDGADVLFRSAWGGVVSHDGGISLTPVNAGFGYYSPDLQLGGGDCWSFSSYAMAHSAGCTAAPTAVALVVRPSLWVVRMDMMAASTTRAAVVATGYDSDAGLPVWHVWTTADGAASVTDADVVGLDGSRMYAGWRLFAQAGWAYDTSAAGQVARTTDGGLTWTTLDAGIDAAYCANGCSPGATFVDARTAWVAAGAAFARTTDGGATWQHASIPTLSNLNAASMVRAWSADGRTIVATVGTGTYRSTDAGTTWVRVLGGDPHDNPDGGLTSVAFADAHHGVAGDAKGTIRVTVDGGRTWSRTDYGAPALANGNWTSLWFSDAGHGWFLIDGVLERTTDGGATWSAPLFAGIAQGYWERMAWFDALHGALVNGGEVEVTADGGTSWHRAQLPIANGAVGDVLFLSPSRLLLSFTGGTTWTSDDAGDTWTQQGQVVMDWYAGNAWLARSPGTHTEWLMADVLWRTDDDGAHWREVVVTGMQSPVAIAFADAQHGWVAVRGGIVFATTDGGASWSSTSFGSDIAITGISVVDSRTAWLATSNGPLLATATGGH